VSPAAPWFAADLETLGIDDRDGLTEALYSAALAYRGWRDAAGTESDPAAPDTLDKVDKPIQTVLELLSNPTNQNRLIGYLLEAAVNGERVPGDDPLREVVGGFFRTLRWLHTLRVVAPKAHRTRPRARPVEKRDLIAAYRILADFWRRACGAGEFHNVWNKVGGSLEPGSHAAWFLFRALRIIDPDRQGVAAELERLMRSDVKGLPGPRQGRATKGNSR
jgi:hypothetical protein